MTASWQNNWGKTFHLLIVGCKFRTHLKKISTILTNRWGVTKKTKFKILIMAFAFLLRRLTAACATTITLRIYTDFTNFIFFGCKFTTFFFIPYHFCVFILSFLCVFSSVFECLHPRFCVFTTPYFCIFGVLNCKKIASRGCWRGRCGTCCVNLFKYFMATFNVF